MKIPKFHDRWSLAIGIEVGIALSVFGWAIGADRIMSGWEWLVGLFIAMVGAGLAIHCIDMLRYYKKHRIVKIEKVDNKRIITKE